jgi:hypothetical protein
MSFVLRINFSGLCLFVPKTDESGVRLMHILMPSAEGGHHAEHRHVPVLGFDTAHLRKGSERRDRIIAQKSIRRNAVHIGQEGATLTVCPDLVNLAPMVADPPAPDLFGTDAGRRLAARVTLGAGKMTAVASGVCWAWGGGVQRITHQVEWTIDSVAAPELNLPLGALSKGSADSLTLHPIPDQNLGKDVIDIFIHHLPPVDMEPEPIPVQRPALGTPAPHFMMYYELFTPREVQTPLFVSTNACPPQECAPISKKKGGSAFNCVVAGIY